MPAVKIFKTTTLPSILEGHSIYLVAPSSKPDHVEIFVTSSDASVVKRVVNIDDITSMINAAIASNNSNAVEIVDDIAARNALSPTSNKIVLVLDATGDPTVSSGSATYVWRSSTSSWIKIAEYESLDVVISWQDIQNRPTSSVADIDSAVAQRHTHTNFTELSKISEDSNGDLLYGGKYPRARLEVVDW